MHRRWILCGLGRLGNSLNQAFIDSGCSWDLICPSSSYSSQSQIIQSQHEVQFIAWADLLETLVEGDVLVLSINDASILSFAQQADKKGVVIIHCSGGTQLPILGHAYSGVFYPLQTFSYRNKPNWKEIPVFLEFQNSIVLDSLLELADKLGVSKQNINHCSSEQRLKVHVAAVFANNFVQTCVAISAELLKESGFNFDVMLPILHQMSLTWEMGNPSAAITGPAVRDDKKTMQKHLRLLENHPQWHELYARFSEIIKQMKS